MNIQDAFTLPTEELHRHTPIPIRVFPSDRGLYEVIARHMADRLKENNDANRPTVFILPVGPTQQYPAFARIVNTERIDCRLLFTFNMDEYLDWMGRTVPETHPLSFRRAMHSLLYERLDHRLRMPADNMVFPDPRNPEECDRRLASLGGADVCYAGVGYHGHVAFNEPIISRWYKVTAEEFMAAGTHLVAIADDTFVINSVREAGGNCEIFPPFAVTMGMKEIMESRQLVGVFYCGSWQRTIFRRTLFQSPTMDYPGTFLKTHPNFQVFVDADTAAPVETNPF
jgi:glucosamine-6-phosphate deaminase